MYQWLVKYNEQGHPYRFWNQTDHFQYGSNDYANSEYLRIILRKYSDYNSPSDWIEDSGGNELSLKQLGAAWHQKYKPDGFDSPIEILQNQQNILLQGIEASKNSWYKVAQEDLSNILNELQKSQIKNIKKELGTTGIFRAEIPSGIIIVHPSTKQRGKIQISYLDKDKNPLGDYQASTIDEAIERIIGDLPVREDIPDDISWAESGKYTYIYEYILRPPSPGAQPKQGFIRAEEGDPYGQAFYNRILSQDELDQYNLNPVGFKKSQNNSWYKVAQENSDQIYKEPWEMTQEEYIEILDPEGIYVEPFRPESSEDYSWTKKEKYPILLGKKNFKNQLGKDILIEFRMSEEKLQYEKLNELGQTLKEKNGDLIYLTDEEIKSKELPLYDIAIIAFYGDKGIGWVRDSFGGRDTDIFVAIDYQKLGIGTFLGQIYRSRFPYRASGGFTSAGKATVKKIHKKMVEQALVAGEEIPEEVLKDYPDLIEKQEFDIGESDQEIFQKYRDRESGKNSWYKMAQTKQPWEMRKGEWLENAIDMSWLIIAKGLSEETYLADINDFIKDPYLRQHFSDVLNVPVFFAPATRDILVDGRPIKGVFVRDRERDTIGPRIMINLSTNENNFIHELIHAQQNTKGRSSNELTAYDAEEKLLSSLRRSQIEKAIKEGEIIPPEVLADYPELQNPIQETEAKNNFWYKTAQETEEIDETSEQTRLDKLVIKYNYPRAGDMVDGRVVRKNIPNLSSIDASFMNPLEFRGIREVPMSAFTLDEAPAAIDSTLKPNKISALAEEIRQSKEINPLIVGLDEKGPYILEGVHRYDALKLLRAKSFPAVIVIEGADYPGEYLETEAKNNPWYKIAEIQNDLEKEWLHIIKWKGPRQIINIPDELKTPEFYLKAIQIRGASIVKFISEEILLQNPEICINAVEKHPNPRRILNFIPEEVKKQNPEIYSKTIEIDPFFSEPVKDTEAKNNSWYKISQKSLNIPEEYRETINDLVEKSKSVGLNIYATGGFVRDLISGAKIPKDLDVMVDVENEELYRSKIQPLIENVQSNPLLFVQNSLSGAKRITNVSNLKIKDSNNRKGLFFKITANIDYVDTSGKSPIPIYGEEFETSINPSLLLSSQYGRNVPRGEMFGIYAINTPIGEVEIAYPRTERYQKGSRKPTTDMGTIEGDAMRRDFGMNALFVDLENGNISDPTGHGLQDIQEKKISVTDPSAIDIIFNDDPLRVLRAIKFASVLPNFTIDQQILEYVKSNPHLIAMKGTEITWDDEEFKPKLSSERIQEELTKILSSKNAPQAMSTMKEMGILNHVIQLPEEAEDWDLDQINPYHYENVWDHTITVMNHLQKVLNEQGINDPERRMILNLEALLHDTGKLIPGEGYQDVETDELGRTTRRRFAGHEDISAEIATSALERLKFPKNIIKRVSKILEYHNDLDKATAEDEIKTTQFIDGLGTDIYDLLLLGMADRRAHVDSINDDTDLKNLYSSLTPEKYSELEAKTKPLINGEEIKEILQIEPGPIIGLIINFIKKSQINQLLNTKEEEQKLLGNLRKISDIIGKEIGPWIEKTLLLLVQNPMGEDPQSIYQWMTLHQKELIGDDNKPIITPLINGNDLISMGIQPGPIFKDILNKILEQQIIGNIRTKEEAIEMVPTIVSEGENLEENNVDKNDLKFSESNMSYHNPLFKFAESKELMESIILKELKQENPNWETIDTFIGDVDHCRSIKDLYYADKDFTIETYQEILDEKLNDDITEAMSSGEIIEAQNKQTQYGDVPPIDTSSPRDIGELESYFGSSAGDAVGLVDSFSGASLDQIKYIGISPETAFLGVTESDLTRQIMQNTITKMYEWSTQNGELTEEDINKIQNMKMEFEAELGESKLLAFRISPNRVVQEVNDIMNNIQQGIQNQPEPEEPINLENIKQDVLTLILGEVIAHEAVHAGGDTGESGPIETEREFLQNYLDSDRFSYLKDFVKLK